MIIVKIIYSILMITWWLGIIKYRKIVKSWTWSFSWAERNIWSGWTYLIIILIWMALIFYWAIYPFWWSQVLLEK